jgi:hypothetical protein
MTKQADVSLAYGLLDRCVEIRRKLRPLSEIALDSHCDATFVAREAMGSPPFSNE